MKNANVSLNLKDLPKQLSAFFAKLGHYRVFLFIMVVAGLYAFIVWRVNSFSNIPAGTTSDISNAVAAQPHIDKDTIDKIHNLQDNSVSVQTLFDEARQNPFQE